MDFAANMPKRKNLGVHYTPRKLAQIVAENTLSRKDESVFDPSCGHASLLEAAGEVLCEMGNPSPQHLLFGVDIDDSALSHVLEHSKMEFVPDNLLAEDFLSLTRDDVPKAPFDVIICNPPFTRHHHIDPERQRIALAAMKKLGIKLPKRSSYWSYFLVHSLSFMKIGGRLAMLLPVALLEAGYSIHAQKLVEKSFKKINVHILRRGYFDRIQEHIILLDAQFFLGIGGRSEGNVWTILNGLDQCTRTKEVSRASGWNLTGVLLDSSVRKVLNKLRKDPHVRTLGDLVQIRIGVVTGANDYFIFNEEELGKLNLDDEWVVPIVTRSGNLKGLHFSKKDWDKIRRNGQGAYLLNTAGSAALPTPLKKYFNNVRSHEIRKRHQCKRRTPWHSVSLGNTPDAFLHYMSGQLPHIVMNRSDATCTNTIHRLMWRSEITASIRRIATISSVTSLAAITAEIEGRGLGGGLLKLEPSNGARILLPVPDLDDIKQTWRTIDAHLRKGEKKEAMIEADKAVLLESVGLDKKTVDSLFEGYVTLRDYRLRRKGGFDSTSAS